MTKATGQRPRRIASWTASVALAILAGNGMVAHAAPRDENAPARLAARNARYAREREARKRPDRGARPIPLERNFGPATDRADLAVDQGWQAPDGIGYDEPYTLSSAPYFGAPYFGAPYFGAPWYGAPWTIGFAPFPYYAPVHYGYGYWRTGYFGGFYFPVYRGWGCRW